MQPKLKFLILIFIYVLILIPQATHAQVIIKEKVEINPQSKTLPEGTISGDYRNPVYLRYGGYISLTLIHRTNNFELWEEQLGKIDTAGTGLAR
jgi:hypothetical protein